MTAFFKTYATPLTTGLFLVSLISGIALFFHLGGAAFHGMHEWLSMVLIAPFGLHIWKNWRSFLAYFKRPPMAMALGLSLAAAIAFALPAMTAAEGGDNPRAALFAVIGKIENASVASVAPIFGQDETSLIAALQEAGYTVKSGSETLSAIGAASGKSGRDVVATLGTLGR